MISTLKDKKFYLLWIASILGGVSVLPYAMAQLNITLTTSIVVAALIQSTLLYAVVVFFGIKASEKLDFKIIPSKKYVGLSIAAGLCVGLGIKLLDHVVFKDHASILLMQVQEIYISHSIAASYYGAVNEEILLRLFAVSLIVLLLQKIAKFSKPHATITSIIVCAVVFGIGHLPMLYKLVSIPNAFDIARVVLLNGFAGIVFGVLYVRYGLTSSMLSHFVADLVIHVFLMT